MEGGAKLNLTRFVEFCKQKFHLLGMALQCRETRRAPQIPIATIFLFVVVSLSLRRKSFHQMDLWARREDLKRFLGSRRAMVVSDATLWRVLPTMNVEQIREFLQQAFVHWKNIDGLRLTLTSNRQLSVGIVDGSCFGGMEASCLQIKSDFGDFFLDLEVYPGKGKELPSTETLLKRTVERHGKSFIDLVLGDGLYLTEGMLTLCRALKLHLLVKTSEEETLNVLKDARGLFDSPAMADRIEKMQGIDEERGVRYTIQAAAGFEHAGYKGTLKVARVVEELLKKTRRPKPEPFWVVTTDERLTAVDLRELAHQRWSVENQGFKMLNEQMNSKHVWTRGAKSRQTFEILMLLMFLAFALVKSFERTLDEKELWMSLRLRRVTLDFLIQTLIASLQHSPPLLGP